ncbi:15531_t:CDS:2 [Acaulospora colombiana]|uniref:15531_t:CDS:1 n=1 Tax=Acaulospora colombiana TaxID=27376 RepID=A0ACA9KW57_9GLOM|nr:15531_t:CDS:2 [Acaulospora colombiana]
MSSVNCVNSGERLDETSRNAAHASLIKRDSEIECVLSQTHEVNSPGSTMRQSSPSTHVEATSTQPSQQPPASPMPLPDVVDEKEEENCFHQAYVSKTMDEMKLRENLFKTLGEAFEQNVIMDESVIELLTERIQSLWEPSYTDSVCNSERDHHYITLKNYIKYVIARIRYKLDDEEDEIEGRENSGISEWAWTNWSGLKLVLAMVYIERLRKANPCFHGEQGCSHRVFFIAFVIASKYVDASFSKSCSEGLDDDSSEESYIDSDEELDYESGGGQWTEQIFDIEQYGTRRDSTEEERRNDDGWRAEGLILEEWTLTDARPVWEDAIHTTPTNHNYSNNLQGITLTDTSLIAHTLLLIPHNNSYYWSNITNHVFSPNEITRMEIDFLYMLRFNLVVNEDDIIECWKRCMDSCQLVPGDLSLRDYNKLGTTTLDFEHHFGGFIIGGELGNCGDGIVPQQY